MSIVVSEPPPSRVDAAAAWELLQRVVNCQELRRAARLRELLLYLGERSLKSHAATIREQEIGEAVFGRPENYDTNSDNIVRVNVSELRKRLVHYFDGEGAAEPVIMDIPRGGYLPVFQARPDLSSGTRPNAEAMENRLPEVAAPPLPRPAEQTTDALITHFPEAAAATPRTPVLVWMLSAALFLALVGVALLWQQTRSLKDQLQPWRFGSARAAFWAQLFASGEQVDLVIADTSYALAQDILKRPISFADYLDYQYMSYANLPGLLPQTRDTLQLVLDRNTGSIGDFDAAEQIMQLNAHSSLVKLASARSYTPQEIKNHNVILIGSQKSNPWVTLYQDRMNFRIDYDPATYRSYVHNRAPIQGEQSTYGAVNETNRDLSVVAFLPNLSEHRYTLILEGTNSQGTRAAGEFITSSEGIAALRQRLPADRYPYFEVLLSSTRLEGTTLQTWIVAARGYAR